MHGQAIRDAFGNSVDVLRAGHLLPAGLRPPVEDELRERGRRRAPVDAFGLEQRLPEPRLRIVLGMRKVTPAQLLSLFVEPVEVLEIFRAARCVLESLPSCH